MLGALLKKIVGTKNDRELKRLKPIVEKINSLEPAMIKMTDAELRAKTGEFKAKIDRGMSLEELLPEAFAVVREVSRRVLNMRPFDVQLMGGIVLHEGKIAEMATGEGKTLVATMPAYLNALTGEGVHIVTVNDYLAKRDSQWMGGIYKFLGMSVGVILHHLDDEERKKAYNCDITYGTNNEFGFDYLRDNMKYRLEDYVQRKLHYAIVDEVDSILIDEARTPLIISGPAEESTEKYYQINRIIPHLKKDRDYTIDEKTRTVTLTEEGMGRVEKLLKVDNLYDPRNMEILHHVNQALKAHTLFKRDVDYMVKNGEVIIVDEFTGRLLPGRRYSEGLHQALEAKEGVRIERENQTLATITFQNYFRMYEKLAGMTGTAATEAEEFHEIYGLDVVVIPTNKPLIRINYPDVIYKTEKEKFNAVVEEICQLHAVGRPVLVGTTSIEKSELLSKYLKKRGIPHHVLNAKYHEKEAEIIAQAGRIGAVTIATNMAGRGTDILLGGNPEFLARAEADPAKDPEAYQKALNKYRDICAKEHDEVVKKKKILRRRPDGTTEEEEIIGGLHVIGTERHEARRVDNQLRGRAGRQGDPGSSRFYLSLEDDLLRIFGGERIASIMDKIGMEENQPIEHNLISKAVENAQKKVEAHNFEIRKHLLEYDDVMNQQRKIIYEQRRAILGEEDPENVLWGMIEDLIDGMVSTYANDGYSDQWDLKGLENALYNQFNIRFNPLIDHGMERANTDGLRGLIFNKVKEVYESKMEAFGKDLFRNLIKVIILQSIDTHWKDHLLAMDYLKEGIGLRGYGQKDPLNEYKKEGFDIFMDMVHRIKEDSVEKLFKVQPVRPEEIEYKEVVRRENLIFNRGDGQEARQPMRREGRKIGRNEPCPCGSGRKYKKCCGQ